MNKPPLIRAVRALDSRTLEIVWSTDETLSVDVSRLLTRFKMYAPLKKAKLFARATVDDWGHSVTWPGNIDMGADALYELARTQAGEWGPEAFNAWMERNELSLNGAADALDMTRRMIAHYRTGSRPIPRVVALACEGWEARHGRHAA
jgi:Protein of unknown function (DUF2442)